MAARPPLRPLDPLPPAIRAGVGLKSVHYREILESGPDIGFFEVHAENYMGAGGPPHRYLEAIRARYPLSIHGVGLSIGAPGELDRNHLERLRGVLKRYEPDLFSEHLAWSTHGTAFLDDLLPLPYTGETLAIVCSHVSRVQDFMGRKMLLENPSTYLGFHGCEFSETAFLKTIARRTGCGLLLDVNNVHVACTNREEDPAVYLDAFPLELVEEIHLAGFSTTHDSDGEPLLIDTHGTRVHDTVWNLYERVLARTGPVPTLIEWDNDVPAWPALMAEAERARACMASTCRPPRITDTYVHVD